MTDSQVSVAKRDSAKALFKTFLDARGGHLQVRQPCPMRCHIAYLRTPHGTEGSSMTDDAYFSLRFASALLAVVGCAEAF